MSPTYSIWHLSFTLVYKNAIHLFPLAICEVRPQHSCDFGYMNKVCGGSCSTAFCFLEFGPLNVVRKILFFIGSLMLTTWQQPEIWWCWMTSCQWQSVRTQLVPFAVNCCWAVKLDRKHRDKGSGYIQYPLLLTANNVNYIFVRSLWSIMSLSHCTW